jgi:hypothetical protein
VQRQFPDVVTIATRAPRSLLRSHAADGSAQVRAVPGLLVERFVEQIEQQANFAVEGRHDSPD